jgi:cell division septal protein FtsQ
MKLIPYTFSFLYPKDHIANAITSLPRVKDVHVKRNKRDISVEFTEYTPFALWCLPHTENSECYFLDETGYAFAPGPQLQGGALARHVREGETELKRGQAFDEGAFSRTHALLARLLHELGLRVTDVLYTEDGDMKLTVNGGGELMLLADAGTYDDAFENLISVLGSEEFRHIEPGNFKYIDLRFGNKVFVNEKLESNVLATSTETVASTTEE